MNDESSHSNDDEEDHDEFHSQSSSDSQKSTLHRHSQFAGPVSAIRYHQLDLRGSEDDIQLSSPREGRRRSSRFVGAMVRSSRLSYTNDERRDSMDRWRKGVNKVIAVNRMYRFQQEEEEWEELDHSLREEVVSDWLDVANGMEHGEFLLCCCVMLLQGGGDY